ncbi:hypothetical protein [Trichothermofontia sp.]
MQKMQKIFVYGLIKNAEKYLEMQVSQLYKALEGTNISFDVLLLENDSKDNTKAICSALSLKYRNLVIHCYDGVDTTYPLRTDRLAFLRNKALNKARNSGAYTYLLALDMDGPNFAINSFDLETALDFLSSHLEVGAVFPNSKPFYYDAYALRSAGQYSFDASRPLISVFECQLVIPTSSNPVEVISAFNGAGLYKLESIPEKAEYVGYDKESQPTCEHVSINQAIYKNGYKLVILPQWCTQAPLEHIIPYLNPYGDGSKTMKITRGNLEVNLYMPKDHPFPQYFNNYPLYDRRFPLLAFLFCTQEPNKSITDIGSNILDGAALVRLTDARNKIYAIDGCYQFCKYALLNKHINSLLENIEVIWGFVGPAELAVHLYPHQGSASIQHNYRSNIQPPVIQLENFETQEQVGLIKIDTDGLDVNILSGSIPYLKRNFPVIFTECLVQSESEIKQWSDLLVELGSDYTYYVVFDNFGFCLYAGSDRNIVLTLIEIAFRYSKPENIGLSGTRIYYVDMCIFPHNQEPLFSAFKDCLHELKS